MLFPWVHQMLSVRTLYLQYAKLEEDYVLAKQAMKVYEEATKQFPERQRLEMCEIYSMLILQQRYLVIVQSTSMSLTMLLQGPAQNSVQRGKEDTYREMLRSKRSVFAGYSQTHFILQENTLHFILQENTLQKRRDGRCGGGKIKQVCQKMKWQLWRGSSCPQCLSYLHQKMVQDNWGL